VSVYSHDTCLFLFLALLIESFLITMDVDELDEVWIDISGDGGIQKKILQEGHEDGTIPEKVSLQTIRSRSVLTRS